MAQRNIVTLRFYFIMNLHINLNFFPCPDIRNCFTRLHSEFRFYRESGAWYSVVASVSNFDAMFSSIIQFLCSCS